MLFATTLLTACGSATLALNPGPATSPNASLAANQANPPASLTDTRWLARASFGITAGSLARLQQLGRARYLEEQLTSPPQPDPPNIAQAIAALPISQLTAEQRLRAARDEQQRINTLATEEDKQAARVALNKLGSDAIQDTARRHLLRALYSPAQLREQMTWFWMNHFSLFSGKANVRWTLAEHEEKVVRPRALGRFQDLLLATMTSPAMLEYLDNTQSAAGRLNENYARELMELHTLGVSGGPSGSSYTQQDVQELARVLTGLGLNASGQRPKLSAERAPHYRADGLFEFNPNRHDWSGKMLLGQPIAPSGLPEAEYAAALLTRQPATARFISAKLATYFVADSPPPPLVERMAARFLQSGGDIAAVLREMLLSPEMEASLAAPAGRFKDPMQFVVSSLRLAYGDRPVANLRPAITWLAQLGEPLYGRVSPDGYPLAEAAWSSPGQMVKRFEIARIIGTGPGGLFNTDDGKPSGRTGFPQLSSRLYYAQIEPQLGPATRAALADAASQAEWNTTLLSSPEWMQR